MMIVSRKGFAKQDRVYPIEIINNTRGGIVIFFSENKRECGDWGQIPVPDVGPSANWLN